VPIQIGKSEVELTSVSFAGGYDTDLAEITIFRLDVNTWSEAMALIPIKVFLDGKLLESILTTAHIEKTVMGCTIDYTLVITPNNFPAIQKASVITIQVGEKSIDFSGDKKKAVFDLEKPKRT